MTQRPFLRIALGASALGMAVIGVATFLALMSGSGPLPNTVVYGSSLADAFYSVAPQVSGVAGATAVVLAVLALTGNSGVARPVVIALAAGIATFFAVTIIAANLMITITPAPIEAKGAAAAGWPSFTLTPPIVGMTAVVIGLVPAVSWLRAARGRRLAITALVIGGVVTAFWLLWLIAFNLLSAGD